MRSRRQFTLTTIFFLVLTGFVAVAQAAEVHLTWDAPLANPNITLAGYRIYWKLAGGTYGAPSRQEIKDPQATSILIANLEEGKTYHFVATAFDTSGNESEYSNEIIMNIPLADTDGDGIADRDEREIHGTDPLLADTDGDGIRDHDEIKTHSTDPLLADTDGDGVSDGDELAGGSDPTNPTSHPTPRQATLPLETGEVNVDHTWTRVPFTQLFVNPVVVATSLSTNNSQAAVVRIRNVETTGFELRVQEWDYLDGTHTPETVGYLVLEHGHHTLPDGTQVEAGRFATNQTTFAPLTFQKPFSTTPVVLTAVTSINEADAVIGRIHNLTPTGFTFRLQEQERNPQTHTTETIAYIAWEPAVGSVNGRTFEIARTLNVVTDKRHTLLFSASFSDSPVFLADMQTTNGSDPANLRWANKDLIGVDVQISEEQSADSEIAHIAEVVGYMLFAPTSIALDTDSDGLSDTEEIMIYGTDPLRADTDGDGLSDRDEIELYGTDPLRADTDGDGLSDRDESELYDTDPLRADTDGDGLSDRDESELYGTDPFQADTDGDGLLDGEEVALWGNNSMDDTDGDGLINLLDPDSDNDGFSDGVEQHQGSDPTKPTQQPDRVQVWLEAEAGQLTAPMKSHTDAAAAAGVYVAVPKGTGNTLNVANARGLVRYTFSVPVSDTYVLWGRVQATGSNYDSFFVRLDGGTAFVWDTQQGSTWLWDQVNNREQADPVEVTLTAGTHTLEILQRESDTRLDRLLITNDPAFVPTGLGEPVPPMPGSEESPASDSEEPPVDPSSVQVWLEAEDGEIGAPMTVFTDLTAAAGAYVAVPKGTGNTLNVANARGLVRYTFSVPVSDTYVLWGRVQAAGSNYDSFFVRLDGGTAFVWDTQQGSTWLWDQVNNREQADPIKMALSAGTHTLEILQRESDTRLDRLLITNDPAFVPTDPGE